MAGVIMLLGLLGNCYWHVRHAAYTSCTHMTHIAHKEEQSTSHERTLVRSERSLRLGLVGALVVVISLVSLPPAISIWTTSLRERLSEQIQTFEDARLRVENNIQSLQAATRGYVITQQPAFLEAYTTAITEVPVDLAQLQELAPLVDRRLVTQVAELADRVTVWQTQGPEQQILLVRQDDLAGAIANISTGQSQRQFDAALEQLRLLNSEIIQINDALTARISGVRTFELVLALT